MSTPELPVRPPGLPASNPTQVVAQQGYTATFYPGFVRTLSVTPAGSEPVVLYDQSGSFVLPVGALEPYTSSVVEFAGGPQQRRLVLRVDDPRREVAAIAVYLKPPGWRDNPPAEPPDPPVPAGAGEEVLLIRDTPFLCPPIC
ncbi:MAG TPA: hypothetical protein VFX98_09670 [Longimicrobiaceae bacterium]|nr:hypothetical protein [Longimicrobiaceae bacterium]